jgi:hypothetical protein
MYNYHATTADSEPVQLNGDEWAWCFLSKVEVENTDRSWKEAGCKVYREDGYWWLRPIPLQGEKDSDEFARCEAGCVSFY